MAMMRLQSSSSNVILCIAETGVENDSTGNKIAIANYLRLIALQSTDSPFEESINVQTKWAYPIDF